MPALQYILCMLRTEIDRNRIGLPVNGNPGQVVDIGVMDRVLPLKMNSRR